MLRRCSLRVMRVPMSRPEADRANRCQLLRWHVGRSDCPRELLKSEIAPVEHDLHNDDVEKHAGDAAVVEQTGPAVADDNLLLGCICAEAVKIAAHASGCPRGGDDDRGEEGERGRMARASPRLAPAPSSTISSKYYNTTLSTVFDMQNHVVLLYSTSSKF
eukprot:scaffold285422_cov33-Tisochrysis_lutea.AAC.1